MKSYRLTAFHGPLEAHTADTPGPSGDQVLLRVRASGVCHSDLHIVDGGYDLGDGRRLNVERHGVHLPLVMGHEIAGEVVAVGDRVEGIDVGRAYVVYPWLGCGACAVCEGGDEQLCATPRALGIYQDGGYADHLIVPHPRYLLELDRLDPVLAAPLACSGLTAFSALKKAGPIVQRAPILVLGAGGVGHASLALVRALGGVGAVVVEVDERKRAAALAAGAIAAVDANARDAAEQIARAAGGPPPVVIDFVGSESSAATAFRCVARSGTLITVGLFGGRAPWSLPLIPLKSLTIRGSFVGSLAEFRELMALAHRGDVPAIPTTRVALDEVNDTLARLRNGAIVGRAVLTP
jgi:D-arabinose 1-dehydrogenase-like Zn-dependent alcohol dehydrogenase